MIVYAEI